MVTGPSSYLIKPDDTVDKIAAATGNSVAAIKAANPGLTDINKIQAGASLNLPGAPATPAPTKTDIGIGTLTTIPKNPIAPVTPSNSTEAPDLSGAYARTGITPPAAAPAVAAPAATKPAGYTPPAATGVPTYPTTSAPADATDTTGAASGTTTAYQQALDDLDAVEKQMEAADVPSDQETSLQQQLDAAKAKVAQFDVGTLNAEQGLEGQGRGATLGTINTRTTVLDRTRALQRLGLSTDADTLATQLSTATDARTAQGKLASDEYSVASKKLDIALNVQQEMDKVSQDQKDDARQYLLDVVNFSAGKTYDQLDPTTQEAITGAVANSPITLDMVKTALQSAADKAQAADQGRLYSVDGLGVVEINKDGSGYKVVVPENPGTGSSGPTPSFADYVQAQNIPLPELTQDKLASLQTEYDGTYGAGATAVNLGKLSSTDKNSLSQAGLGSAPSGVQSYFLNTPPAFQQSFSRDKASGKVPAVPTLDDVNNAYTTWYNEQQNNNVDWAKLLDGTS